jgi:hypothetical protein
MLESPPPVDSLQGLRTAEVDLSQPQYNNIDTKHRMMMVQVGGGTIPRTRMLATLLRLSHQPHTHHHPPTPPLYCPRTAAPPPKVSTTRLATEDLEKYHRALEKALLTFHASKMADINKVPSLLLIPIRTTQPLPSYQPPQSPHTQKTPY